MSPLFFIYAKTLSPSQIDEFAQKSAVELLKQHEFLNYNIAFFRGELTDHIQQNAHAIHCDISRLDITPRLSHAGLLLMDMDSTAIKIECIDEIAKLAGMGEEVSAITASAMRGELDFEQSLRRRVSTLKDAPETILQTVRQNLPLMDGFEVMISSLQRYGWKIAIASGGFDYFADYLKEKYSLDYAIANRLEIQHHKLTGNVLGSVVDAKCKVDTLKMLGEHYQIPASQWVAVGDGANDLPMLKAASLGIALHAKPKVQEQAKYVVNFGDLTALVLLLNAHQLFID